MSRLTTNLFWISLAVLGVLAAYHSFVFVDEGEFVVITRFGEIVAVYDQISEESSTAHHDRGLHFKVPWYGVRRFDRRLQIFDPPAREMVTKSRGQGAVSAVGGNLMVDCYVCWQIPATRADADLAQADDFQDRPVVRFLRTVRSLEGAEARLEKLILSKLGNEIAQVQLADLLDTAEVGTPLEETSELRAIGQRVKAAIAEQTAQAGIKVIDVQIKRLNLPDANRTAVYARQRSERQRIATKYRSEGEAEATRLKSEAEREREAVLSQAKRKGQQIRGEGEARAAEVYAAAYGRDPEFFRLQRTLQAYEKMLGEKTTLVLSATSEIFKLLSEGLPPLEKQPPSTRPRSTKPPAQSGKDPPISGAALPPQAEKEGS